MDRIYRSPMSGYRDNPLHIVNGINDVFDAQILIRVLQ